MNNYLNVAIEIAKTSKHRFRMGAVVVKGGSILAVGVNRRTNDASQEGMDWRHCSVHAEASALKKAGYPRNAKIFVARVLKDGTTPAIAKPCFQCAALIESLGGRAIWTE